MIELDVWGKEKKAVKKLKTSAAIFGMPLRRQLLCDLARITELNRRQGTVRRKTRGEVAGTTAKMYRQKGTGRARHGDAKANIFVGGGIAFPPLPREWRRGLPEKARRKALASILSERVREGNLFVVETLDCPEIKTKALVAELGRWDFSRGLIVSEGGDEKLLKSARNIPGITVRRAADLQAYDVLKFGPVLMTEKALKTLEARLQ